MVRETRYFNGRKDLLNFLAAISGVVFTVCCQGEQNSSSTFRIAILYHNLSKNLGWIEEFKGLVAPDFFVACKSTISVLHGQEDVHRISETLEFN